MLDAGLLDEVRALAARPAGLSRTAARGARLQGTAGPCRRRLLLDEAGPRHHPRQFAVRQLRWFQLPRIRWVEMDDDGDDAADLLVEALNR